MFGHGYTFGGHPVSSAVALANLDIFEREGINDHVKEMAPAFRSTLEKLYDLPIVGDVRGEGFFYGIELVKDKATKETFNDEESERLLRGFLTPALFEAGLYCRADDRGDPVVQLAPPLISGQKEFDAIYEILHGVLDEASRRCCSRRANVGDVPTSSRKPPIDPVRWNPPPVDPLPDFPSAELTVVPVPGDAPEDVVVDGDGQIWAGLIDGKIVRIAPDGGEPVVVADIDCRPLGLHVARDGRLLICSSPGGLLALDPATGTVETLVGEVDGRGLQFCSNVTELADGTIYFTESTSAFTYEHFLGPIFEARNRGSMFRRDPDGTVLTAVAGLYFANGITPTADGSALVFAETQARRLSKLLAHRRQGGNGDAAGGQPSRQAGQPVDGCRRPDLVRDGVAHQRGRGVDAEDPAGIAQAAVATA